MPRPSLSKFCFSLVLVCSAATVKAEVSLPIPVIVYASDTAKIASPLSGFITGVEVKEGQLFKKGERLLNFDCQVLNAEKQQAQAKLDKQKTHFYGLQRLLRLHAASSMEVSEARAEWKQAEANFTIKSYYVSRCKLDAPFNGQVIKLYAHPHEYIAQGKPLLDIVDSSSVELKLIVPSDWLTWLKIGDPFKIKIKETGKGYPARVKRISFAVDPVSHTVNIYGELNKTSPEIHTGMSGEALFDHK